MKSKLIMFGVIAMMLASCATYEKKLNKFQLFALNHPAELAKLCADKFQVKEITKPGRIDTVPGKTVYLPGDSIPCPDGTKVKSPDKKVQCPPSTICTPDTIRMEDTAKLFLMAADRDKYKDSLNVMKGKLEAVKKISSSRLWIIIGVAGAIALAIFSKFKGWL